MGPPGLVSGVSEPIDEKIVGKAKSDATNGLESIDDKMTELPSLVGSLGFLSVVMKPIDETITVAAKCIETNGLESVEDEMTKLPSLMEPPVLVSGVMNPIDETIIVEAKSDETNGLESMEDKTTKLEALRMKPKMNRKRRRVAEAIRRARNASFPSATTDSDLSTGHVSGGMRMDGDQPLSPLGPPGLVSDVMKPKVETIVVDAKRDENIGLESEEDKTAELKAKRMKRKRNRMMKHAAEAIKRARNATCASTASDITAGTVSGRLRIGRDKPSSPMGPPGLVLDTMKPTDEKIEVEEKSDKIKSMKDEMTELEAKRLKRARYRKRNRAAKAIKRAQNATAGNNERRQQQVGIIYSFI